jgi:hypothetical protein
MAKKFAPPQWLKDALADYRSLRAAGDVPAAEMPELLTDRIDDRHSKGDPFPRDIWREYVVKLDRDTAKTSAAKADEAAALEAAAGFLQPDLFPADALIKLGLPPVLDLGSFGKRVDAPDATRADVEKWKNELERKKNSWDESLTRQIDAAYRLLDLMGADDSRTVRDVIADPDDGFGQIAL